MELAKAAHIHSSFKSQSSVLATTGDGFEIRLAVQGYFKCASTFLPTKFRRLRSHGEHCLGRRRMSGESMGIRVWGFL